MVTITSGHVVGMSYGRNNEDVFADNYPSPSSWEWISVKRDGNNTIVTLLPLARRPKKEGEQFPPTFSTDELLKIAGLLLPPAKSFQNQDVYFDGIMPVALAMRVGTISRYARSVHVNVPREGGWKKVSERPCEFESIIIGDLVRVRVFGNVVCAEVKAVSDSGIQVAELNKGRRNQRVWINEYRDLIGWKDEATTSPASNY